MKHISVTLIIIVLLANFIIYSSKQSKLIGVVEMIRHGARTPSTFMDASAKLYFGARRAQLTVNGYRQHVLLGRWIRRRYYHGDVHKLFSKTFDPQEIKIFSSPRQRTIFSATAHIMGIFPESIIKIIFGSKKFRNNDQPPLKNYKMKKIDGKEVDVHVLSYKNDYIFHTLKCHRKGSSKKLKVIMKRKKIFNLSKEEIYRAVIDILKKYNFLFKNRHSFSSESEYKEFQRNYKKKVFTKRFFKKLVAFIRPFKYHHNSYNKLKKNSLKTVEKYLLNKWYQTRINDSKELKLGVSAYFEEIVQFFKKRINNENKEKMLVLSGHDTNIVNFISNILDPGYLKKKIKSSLTNLKDYTFLVPPLATSILLELHQSTKGSYFINIVYNGKSINNVKFRTPVKLVKNGKGVDYEDFRNLLKSRIMKSYKYLVCGSKLVVK